MLHISTTYMLPPTTSPDLQSFETFNTSETGYRHGRSMQRQINHALVQQENLCTRSKPNQNRSYFSRQGVIIVRVKYVWEGIWGGAQGGSCGPHEDSSAIALALWRPSSRLLCPSFAQLSSWRRRRPACQISVTVPRGFSGYHMLIGAPVRSAGGPDRLTLSMCGGNGM